MGQVRGSKLHLRLLCPLQRQSAAAPSSRFPLSAGINILAQALLGGRPCAPLIGFATPLVTLFCLNGQRLKAASTALQAELEGGTSCSQLPRKPLLLLCYHWLGNSAKRLALLGSPDILVAEAPSFLLQGPRDETAIHNF